VFNGRNFHWNSWGNTIVSREGPASEQQGQSLFAGFIEWQKTKFDVVASPITKDTIPDIFQKSGTACTIKWSRNHADSWQNTIFKI
jgi:hypothetical protein